ncbi:MAG: glycosyl hydrolase family protein [Bacteroidetes bacterium]|nr:MAG: glycosyl hydrolase family protein [Bacteroidota bacterium]
MVMKSWITFLALIVLIQLAVAQEWEGIEVPPSPGAGMVWELQPDVSDDFNYQAAPNAGLDTLGGKWINWYHNPWTGPLPTIWRRDHAFVTNGNMNIIASRPAGDSVWVSNRRLAVTNLGCVTSVRQVQYPVYIEARVKIMKSVLASDVWLLSSDDTQEIDICEAYGGDRWTNPWFSNQRLHLSHHVFIRQPFTDWQPNDEGSFYTDGSTVWSDDYHRIGVFWRDPWHLEYYVDGQLVRTRSGKDQIDPVFHTNAVNPGDPTNDTRTGLNKPMDIIINTEDQTWRALQGLTPTDEELADTAANTFQVDWIRVYKPVAGEVGSVRAVTIDPAEVVTFVGDVFTLNAIIDPPNANDLSVSWLSDNPDVASVSQEGVVSCHAEGLARIIVTTHENQLKDTCMVRVSGEAQAPSLDFDDRATYLNTIYEVGGELRVAADFHAGSGNTVVDGGLGGVRFWLREIRPGWQVVHDYVVSDSTTIGQESGRATGIISLEGVPPTAEIPAQNWYFLYVTFRNSDGDFFDQGIWPIQIARTTNLQSPESSSLHLFPNPARSQLNVELPQLKGRYAVEVISATGQSVVLPQALRGSSLQLNIDHLPAGMYVLLLRGERVYRAIFVKE